jgi:transposase
MQDGYHTLISLLLPDFILDFFELKEVRKEEDIFHLELQEVNITPNVPDGEKLLSKGFFPTITVQDFPIRGHKVFFHIRRRRWLNTEPSKVIYRNWTLVEKGTRMTGDFTAFLKEINRYSADSIDAISSFYGVKAKNLLRQYRDYLSDFKGWDQKPHAKKWLLFPQNLGKHLSIDETSLSHGELYTILTNKAAKGKKGAIVALVAGTKAETIISALQRIPEKARKQVSEITLDMAGNMELICKRCFPQATRVTDRFHVQKLATEALQEMRIKYRWEALDSENEAIEKSKKTGISFQPEILPNGDTLKQLLARSRYVLYKKPADWTTNQKDRAGLLFEHFPDLKTAYGLSLGLSQIFENTKDKVFALANLARESKADRFQVI